MGAACSSVGESLDNKPVSLKHFQVERILGKGGFGTVQAVFKKTEPGQDIVYALKRISKRKLLDSQQITLLPPDLTKRKTFLRLTCDIEGANVYIDGTYMGKTPIKKISVNPGWHRIRVIDPDTPRPQFAMRVPDYQDVYIPQGKSQKIRINLATSETE